MKNRSGFLQLLLFSIVISSFVGCDSPTPKKQPYETLVFNVDETLLEPIVTDPELKIKIAAPKNWKKIDDSMLTHITDNLDLQITEGQQMLPRWIFFNESSRSICIVSELKGVEIVPDAALLKTLEIDYQNRFPKAKVQGTIFMKDGFRIHQLMVSTADFVRIKLICDAPETLVFEVDYHIPKDVYQTELRAVESSIGSINLIHKNQ